MAAFTDVPPPEAPDYPPDNAFDVQLFTANIAKELRASGAPAFDDEALAAAYSKGFAELIGFILNLIGHDAGWIIGLILKAGLPIIEGLVTGVGEVLKPGMEALGVLTTLYVQQFVDQQKEIQPGAAGEGPSGLKPAAAGLFDSILAPLGFLVGGANPATTGAGETNAQFVLGSIVGIHLSSWMVNIISNLTGLGYLKWINSFDDVITAAISSRGLSRMAMKPYLAKFIGDPLERDLNLKLPLKIGQASGLVKRYIRGNMTAEELKAALRGQGYDDDVVADLLLDTKKFMPQDLAAWLVGVQSWTAQNAGTYLEHQGYEAGEALLVAEWERNTLVRAQYRSLASSLVDAFIDRRLDNSTLRHLLDQAGFTPDEIDAMVTRGAILQELSRRLTLAQVRSLFQEDLVDLDYVLSFLHDEGYGDDEVDLLALLEFTLKEDREQRKKDLLERRRIALEAQLGFEQQAERARTDELAALGGPTA